jgi:hypothetical protein
MIVDIHDDTKRYIEGRQTLTTAFSMYNSI